jgi:hypothetical protein
LKRILVGVPIGLAKLFAFEPETSRRAFYAAEEPVEIGKGPTPVARSAITYLAEAFRF